MQNLYPTPHGLQRAKERAGWNRRSALRMLERALYDGLRAEECGRALGTYLRSLAARNAGHFARIYGEHVFIFGKDGSPTETALVTVLHLPHPLRSAALRPAATIALGVWQKLGITLVTRTVFGQVCTVKLCKAHAQPTPIPWTAPT